MLKICSSRTFFPKPDTISPSSSPSFTMCHTILRIWKCGGRASEEIDRRLCPENVRYERSHECSDVFSVIDECGECTRCMASRSFFDEEWREMDRELIAKKNAQQNSCDQVAKIQKPLRNSGAEPKAPSKASSQSTVTKREYTSGSRTNPEIRTTLYGERGRGVALVLQLEATSEITWDREAGFVMFSTVL